MRNGAERSQWGAAIAVLTFVAAVLVGAVFSSNQVVHADTCIYDVATVACVDVRTGAGADAGSAQLTGVRELATSPPAGTRGPSTTSSGSLVATNTADDVARVVDDVPTYGSTPGGRPYTKHYGTETGPQRNIPGSVVDGVFAAAARWVRQGRHRDGRRVWCRIEDQEKRDGAVTVNVDGFTLGACPW